MPLHDWADRPGWEGVHHVWITELLDWIQPRLPEGYRAYIGSAPTVAINDPDGRPDVSVRQWLEPLAPTPIPEGSPATEDEPEVVVATMSLDPGHAVFVAVHGRLVAAVELVSPRNKDRPSSRTAYLHRYLGYLYSGVHLLLIDVLPRPRGFSFADAIAADLQLGQQPMAPPMAVSYRVGEPAATGGRMLGIWRRPLTIGAVMPTIQLPLTVERAVPVDLESTYTRAAARFYIS